VLLFPEKLVPSVEVAAAVMVFVPLLPLWANP